MKFKAVGNRTKSSVFSGLSGTLASAARLATFGVGLAVSLGVAGCGQTGGSPGANASGTGSSGSQSSQLSPSAAGVSFGNVTIGSSTSQLVTLTAAGKKNVTISNVTASGTGFVVSAKSNVVLAPGQSLTVSVSFEPKSAGNSAGQLLVASNASNSTLDIALSGAGVTQAASGHSVTLNWQPSASAVTGYFVFRGSSASTLSQLSASAVASTSYTDKTIANGQTYVYAVKSIDSSDVLSGFSNYVTVAVPAD
jgi:Abnormal spindle-like microcephaly-assoc'd, ASPM-SPD-2-Hydin